MSPTNHHRRDPGSPPDREGPEPNESHVGAPTTPASPRPGPLRILVVDDEESVRVSLKMLLESDGHQVDTVMTAEEAVARFHQRTFDLVMTDYALPGMNGDSLAAAVGTDANACPVIIITAYAQKLPRKLPYVDCILDKPFSGQDLRDAIARAMRTGLPASHPSAPERRHPAV